VAKAKTVRDPLETARKTGELALTRKAEDVVLLDLTKVAAATDYFVIASGASDVQVKAIADAIVEGLEQQGIAVWHVEGYANRRWILVDLVDVVVHVFHRDARDFYGLERLWGDVPRTQLA
jgi:ribosome-associated protein